MRIVTGDETGLFKVVSIEDNRTVVAGVQTRSREVRGMCWSGAKPGEDLLILHADGVVTTWTDMKLVRILLVGGVAVVVVVGRSIRSSSL